MNKKSFCSAALGAVLVGATLLGSAGCYVEAEPAVYAEGGYEPQYYDGYVVYYDDGGRPYYYVNGTVYWVPPSSPLYVRYTNHWRVHRAEYGRWYAHHGYRYRTYRRRYR